ncbi:MAG: hypothetical protein QOI07_893 [Verrucomicrobiota bacterium]|jgi:hypothetical protein
MTLLTRIFLATTIALALFSAAMVCAVLDEANRSSIYSQQSYRNGLKDGESFIRGQMVKDQAESELLKESREHITEEKL